ncbi:MAG: proton-conducting transporter membrane subunit, partial [Pseudomonadota bacterium]
PVAMFHLFTHAWFKAMLFLGAGSVIHGMHHEQDMMNYGGLRKKLPVTFWTMLIGTLAITGVGIPLTGWIGFAGFASKDAVIESAYVGSTFAFWALVIAALMTSFYSWRLMFLTFWGEPRGDKHTHEHAHESPTVMLIPLGVLSLGAIFAGAIWYGSFFGKGNQIITFFGGQYEAPAKELKEAVAERSPKASELKYVMAGEPGEAGIYMRPENTVIHEAHYVPTWVKLSPFIAMLLGFLLSFQMYIRRPEQPKQLAEMFEPAYLFLKNKWYFDELYDFIFVQPAKMIGRFLWRRGDGDTIDGALNGVAMGVVPFFTRLAGRVQSGYIFTYAFAMVIGIAVLVTWMTIGGAN